MIDRGDQFSTSVPPTEPASERESMVSQHFLDGRKSDKPTHRSSEAETSGDWKSQIQASLSHDLAAVEGLMKRTSSCRYEEVNELSTHAVNMGGKRLRPMLAILSAKAVCPEEISGRSARQLHRVAAAVELVHSASLLHDDVMDEAQTRRHLPTVGRIAGSSSAILLGDYLFTKAYELAAGCSSPYPAKRIAHAASMLCQGELRQQLWAGNFEISPNDYRQLLLEKTASLCAASCALGAWSTFGGKESSEKADTCDPQFRRRILKGLSAYGCELGLAFQLFDDWLDYWGTEDLGKELGKDLNQRKPTLPLIRYLRQASSEQRSVMMEIIDSDVNNEERFQRVRTLLEKSDASEYTLAMARRCVHRALNHLESVPSSETPNQRMYRESLIRIAEFSAARRA